MSYTSRSSIQINETLFAISPIRFTYVEYTQNVEKTLFQGRLDLTDFDGVLLSKAAQSGGAVDLRLYSDGVLIASTGQGGALTDIYDISAYTGSHIIDIRLFSNVAGGGSIRNYIDDGSNSLYYAVEVQFLHEF